MDIGIGICIGTSVGIGIGIGISIGIGIDIGEGMDVGIGMGIVVGMDVGVTVNTVRPALLTQNFLAGSSSLLAAVGPLFPPHCHFIVGWYGVAGTRGGEPGPGLGSIPTNGGTIGRPTNNEESTRGEKNGREHGKGKGGQGGARGAERRPNRTGGGRAKADNAARTQTPDARKDRRRTRTTTRAIPTTTNRAAGAPHELLFCSIGPCTPCFGARSLALRRSFFLTLQKPPFLLLSRVFPLVNLSSSSSVTPNCQGFNAIFFDGIFFYRQFIREFIHKVIQSTFCLVIQDIPSQNQAKNYATVE